MRSVSIYAHPALLAGKNGRCLYLEQKALNERSEGFYREMPDVTAVQLENLNMNQQWKNQQRPPVKQAFKDFQCFWTCSVSDRFVNCLVKYG